MIFAKALGRCLLISYYKLYNKRWLLFKILLRNSIFEKWNKAILIFDVPNLLNYSVLNTSFFSFCNIFITKSKCFNVWTIQMKKFSFLSIMSFFLCVSFNIPTKHFTSDDSGHKICVGFPPHQALLCDTSWVSNNSTQLWRYLPGGSVGSPGVKGSV